MGASRGKGDSKYEEEGTGAPMKVKEASHFKESDANPDDSKAGNAQEEGHRGSRGSSSGNDEKENGAYKNEGSSSVMNGRDTEQRSDNDGVDGKIGEGSRYKAHNVRPSLSDREESQPKE